ncbi:MAG: PorV/PorQ family protein [Bacteriovoracaceae bacterium]|nr:PorV/PorQ family protein [Bacteroidota bacterium]
MKTTMYFFALLLFVLFTSNGVAQSFKSNVSKKGTTAAPFLSISQGAKGIAMGGAYVAVAHDASAIFWNPAGISDIYGGSLVVDHTQWLAGINYNFIAGTYAVGDIGTIGLSFTSSDIDEMRVTTVEMPDGNGETFAVTDIAVSVAYALKLTDKFSIGFNPKFIHQKIWKMSASAFAIDVGVKYETPFDGVMLGMSISNFGQKMQMQGKSSLVLFDQDLNSSGNNGRIPANLATDEWALPLNFKFGIAYTALKDDVSKLMIAVDASHPSDDYESVDVGAEYIFYDFIALRGGYKSLFLSESETGLTLGVGVMQAIVGGMQVSFDYAYQDFGRLKEIQKFSVGLNF